MKIALMRMAQQCAAASILNCCRVVINRSRALTTKTSSAPNKTLSADAVSVGGVGGIGSGTVDEQEIARFNQLSSSSFSSTTSAAATNEWADENGPFKALHSFNRLRVPWIVEGLTKAKQRESAQPLEGLRIVDVGAGGGILSLALCRLGADVVGVDASAAAIKAAEAMSKSALRPNQLDRIKFINTSVEQFAIQNFETFDGVVASEIVEHVADLEGFVRACGHLAKPKASLFFTTINKTWLSELLAIRIAEDVLSLVPRGVHDWEKFVPPEELRHHLIDGGCRVRRTQGAVYNPLTNAWSWSSFEQVNYAVSAMKI